MKKTIKYAVLVIALFLAGFCGYMERKYSAIRMVKSEIIPEKILEEFPEIAITEGDLALSSNDDRAVKKRQYYSTGFKC